MRAAGSVFAVSVIITCLLLCSSGPALADSSSEWNLRGIESMEAGNVDGAIGFFKKATETGPASAVSYRNLGDAYRVKGGYRNALSCYDKAITLDPKSPAGYEARSALHRELGNCAIVSEDFNRIIELTPGDTRAYAAMAWFLAASPITQCRDGKRGVELGEKAVSMAPAMVGDNGKARFYHVLAAAYAESGNFDKASAAESQAYSLYKPANAGDRRRDTYRALVEAYKNKQTYLQWSAGFDRNAFSSGVRDRILAHVTYPPGDANHRIEGTATVSFVVEENGLAGEIEVIKTSGQETLDRATVRAIRQSEPFPGPPLRLRLAMPIVFKTENTPLTRDQIKFAPMR
jgi:TonB family protein